MHAHTTLQTATLVVKQRFAATGTDVFAKSWRSFDEVLANFQIQIADDKENWKPAAVIT